VPDVFKGIRDKSFELAVDSYCLCLLSGEDLAYTLKEIHRMLRPGGRFFSLLFTDRTSASVFTEGGPASWTKLQIHGQFRIFPTYSVGCERREEGDTVVETWVVSATKES
jgi:ubiquinone/menaquinone biosynthesis C-methylase UbiE